MLLYNKQAMAKANACTNSFLFLYILYKNYYKILIENFYLLKTITNAIIQNGISIFQQFIFFI